MFWGGAQLKVTDGTFGSTSTFSFSTTLGTRAAGVQNCMHNFADE